MPFGFNTGGIPIQRIVRPIANALENPASDFVNETCPECWKEGCGISPLFGACADGLELINPVMGRFANLIWILGSPFAFPCIFCFPSDPHTNESSGYDMSMLEACYKKPCTCCLSTLCLPCGQWYARYRVLDGDMTKYKLWQGYHDGPHCCARRCPGKSPCIVIESGTYGEQDCPKTFLCLEICCLGGLYSICCAFDVSRKYQRDERGLLLDPTEARQQRCIQFFSKIMHQCFKLGCCFCIGSCCVGLCAPDSDEAQDCAGQGKRASRSCCRIAHTIWKGIIWTRVLAIGCMTAQMVHESNTDWDGKSKKGRPDLLKMSEAPTAQKMRDRGFDDDNNDGDGSTTNRTGGSSSKDDLLEFDEMVMPWEEEAEKEKKKNAPRGQRMDRGGGGGGRGRGGEEEKAEE